MKKRILITGSTDGIGRLAALKFADEGHFVYLHGRNREKLFNIVSDIKKETGNENVEGFISDFSELFSVKKMALEVNEKLPYLDILINNAGVFKSPESINWEPLNKNGMDMRFVVNFLAPYILTEKLIPLLQNGEDPRIINLSSAAQSGVSMDALHGKERLSESEAYAQSKLALTMWSFYLADNFDGISVIALNPGSLLNTKMAREAYGNYWSSADKGASIIHDLALLEKYKGISGKYFDNDQGNFGYAHQDAYDDEKVRELIHSAEILTGELL